MPVRLKLRIGVTLALTVTGASAQSTWQHGADLLSSGAAASVVAYYLCEGQSSGDAAGQRTRNRLAASAARMGASAEVADIQQYLYDATNLKIKAFWQAHVDQGCDGIQQLRYLAQGVGFDTP